jgi:hypothetical protein
MGGDRDVCQVTFLCKSRKWSLPFGGRQRNLAWEFVRSTTRECGFNRREDAAGFESLPLEKEDEVDQVLHPRIGPSFAWPRIRVEFLGPVLLHRQGRNGGPCDAGEPKPVLADDLIERVEDLIARA